MNIFGVNLNLVRSIEMKESWYYQPFLSHQTIDMVIGK